MRTAPAAAAAVPGTARDRRRPRRRTGPERSRIGYLLIAGYVLLLLAFGVLPALYAFYLSLTREDGSFAGLANFTQVVQDYRFVPAIEHVGTYLAIWLVSLIFFVIILALAVHAVRLRWLGATARFVFYVPGALAGASSVLLWIFMLDPAVSPVSALLRLLGADSFAQAIEPGNLPVVFAVIAFWTGAGGWIVIMNGALNNISSDVMEAARIDGAGPVRMALGIQLPLIRKWVYYMIILSLAAGTQLFVEPQLVSQASLGIVGNDYSLNQLAYLYAFQQNNFNGSAALSIMLLIVAVGLSAFFVARGGLFRRD